MVIIGKRMKSSGFADILEASKIYKPTVIEGICFYYINYNNTTTLPNERLQISHIFEHYLIPLNIILNSLFLPF